MSYLTNLLEHASEEEVTKHLQTGDDNPAITYFKRTLKKATWLSQYPVGKVTVNYSMDKDGHLVETRTVTMNPLAIRDEPF